MNGNIDYLAILYNKIADKTASNEEKFMYETEVKRSCVRDDVFIKSIKNRAKEIKKRQV